MLRVTSLAEMPDKQLNRLIRRIALLFVVLLIAFVGFYALDRYRPAAPPIADRELAALEDAVRADPSDVASRGRLADLYFAKERFDDAITQYTVLIDAGKEVELASLGRARAYQQTGQYAAATTDFQKVVSIAVEGEMANVDPNLASAYYGLGTVALAQGHAADAIDPLKKALAIQRTDADALNALAEAYLQTDQPKLAIEPLTLAVTLVPVDWAQPYRNLETAYGRTGDGDMAAWAGAMAAFADGDVDTAEARLLTLVDGSQGVRATVGLGLIAEKAGDTAAAADWYRKALALDPEDRAAGLGLSRVSVPSTGATAAPTAPAPSPAEGSN